MVSPDEIGSLLNQARELQEEMQDEELEALEDDRAYAEDEPDPLNPVLEHA